jgi:pyridoxal phosphate enzyme (YggS family)
MPVHKEAYQKLVEELRSQNVSLVAVSKTKTIEEIKELYDLGHRDFGENYAQEVALKHASLPKDIRWHFIGHLQSNKVKIIIPFVQLIQSVDSLKLLKEINKQAEKKNTVVECLLQVHIAQEETKFGFDEHELHEIFDSNYHELPNAKVVGLMGMATLTDDMNKVRKEFRALKELFNKLTTHDSRLSMGMSADYKVAIEEGSNMVRIGSLVFGEREK